MRQDLAGALMNVAGVALTQIKEMRPLLQAAIETATQRKERAR